MLSFLYNVNGEDPSSCGSDSRRKFIIRNWKDATLQLWSTPSHPEDRVGLRREEGPTRLQV